MVTITYYPYGSIIISDGTLAARRALYSLVLWFESFK